jgi:hypothetical protein
MQAVENFIAMKKGHALSDGRIKGIMAFLKGRLVSFAAAVPMQPGPACCDARSLA